MNFNTKKEYCEEVHNRVIGWTENCDLKASILLTFIGIVLTFIFTSDYILPSIEKIISPICKYWKFKSGEFDLFAFLILFFFILGLVLMIISINNVLKVLKAKTVVFCEDKNKKGFYFFRSIQTFSSFDEYVQGLNIQTEENLIKEKLNEIYICSKRCNEKFDQYNNSVKFFKWGMFSLGVSIILLLIFNSK